MDRNVPTLTKPLKGAYNLLLVSVVGIASCSIALLVYHFLLLVYLRWQRRNNAPSPHTVSDITTTRVEQFSGIDQKLLDTIPIVIYSVNNRCAFCLDQIECAVCLGELDEVDVVRVLPGCKHAFHVSCIDQWFKGHVNCPLCRSPVGALVEDIVIELPIKITGRDEYVATEDTPTPLTTGSKHVSIIRHCTSMVLGREWIKKEFLQGNLRRSVSMDQFMTAYAQKRSLELV